MRVLVLDSGPTSSYHVMRSVARAGHEVHLASYESNSLYFKSRYCARPITAPAPTDRAAYHRFLVGTVEGGDYGLLFFCGDDEAEAVWDLRDTLAPHVRCFLPEARWRGVAFSKFEAYCHVAGLGVAVPRALDVHAATSTPLPSTGYPLVVKCETGSAGRLVRYACNRQQLLAQLAEVRRLAAEVGAGKVHLQEYIPGPTFVVHALFHQGQPMALCSHKKVRDWPMGRGVTSAAVTVNHAELDAMALDILRSLAWNGLVKMDFKRDQRTGKFTFIELDPRVSASIDITRVAGADQAVMLCDLAAGKNVRPQLTYKTGVRYRWAYPRDAIRLLREPWRTPRWLVEQLLPNTHWDLDLSDPTYTLGALRLMAWHLKEQLRSRAVWQQARTLAEVERTTQSALVRRRHDAGRTSRSLRTLRVRHVNQ